MKKLLLQQNRFLALVSNVDYYKNALSLAENSEDAGTLQALKTMDSLESKIQQVKTSMEQFYSSMGIEKFLKGTLTTVNTVIKNINKMTKPQAFVTLINLFKGAKTMVMSSFAQITTEINQVRQHFENLQSGLSNPSTIQVKNEEAIQKIEEVKNAAEEIKTLQMQLDTGNALASKMGNIVGNGEWITSSALGKFKSGKSFGSGAKPENVAALGRLNEFVSAAGISREKFNAQVVERYGKYDPTNVFKTMSAMVEEQKTSNSQNAEKLQALLDGNKDNAVETANLLARQQEARQANTAASLRGLSALLSSIGATITTIALSVKDKSTDTVEGSKIGSGAGSLFSAGGGALSGLATAAMIPTVWGKVAGFGLALVNSLPSLISGITQIADGLDYNTAEKLAAATSEAEESKTEALKKKSEERNLKNDLERLKTLEAAQYDSAEAQQEYKAHMEQLADTYPNLVTGMDAAGNAIIKTVDMEQALANARKATASATLKATESELNNLEKKQDAYNDALVNLQAIEPLNTEEFDLFSVVSKGEGDLFDALNEVLQNNFKGLDYKLEDYLSEKFPKENIPSIYEGLLTSDYFKADNFVDDKGKGEALLSELLQAAIEQYNSNVQYDENGNATNHARIEQGANANLLVKKQLASALAKAGLKLETDIADYDDEEWAKLTSEEVNNIITRAQQLVKDTLGKTSEDISKLKTDIENQKLYNVAAKVFTDISANGYERYSQFQNLYQTLLAVQQKDFDEYGRLENIDEIISKTTDLINQIPIWQLNEFEEYLSNPSKIRANKQEFSTQLKALGLNDAETIDGLWVNYIEQIKDARKQYSASINNAFTTGLFSSETQGNTLKFLGDKLLPEYYSIVQSTLAQANDLMLAGYTVQADGLISNLVSVASSIGVLDGETQARFLNIFTKIDFTSRESIQTMIEALEGFLPNAGDETGAVKAAINSLKNAQNSLTLNVVTEVQQLTNSLKDTAESVEKAYSSYGKSGDFSDTVETAIGLLNSSIEEAQGKTLADLIQQDKRTGEWNLTGTGFSIQMAFIEKKIQENKSNAEEAAQVWGENITDQIGNVVNALGNEEDLVNIWRNREANPEEYTQLTERITKNLKQVLGENFNEQYAQNLINFIATDTSGASIENLLKTYFENIKDSVENYEALLLLLPQLFSTEAIKQLDIEGIVRGTADIETQKQLLSTAIKANWESLTEAEADSIAQFYLDNIDLLLQSSYLTFDQQSTGLKANIEKYTTALDELLKGPGTIISGSTSILLDGKLKLDDAGHTIAATMDECITVALDVYKGLAETNISIAELNHSYASIITAQMSDYANASALGAGSFSIDTFGEILAAGNKKLEDYWDAEAKEFNTEIKTLEFDKTTQNVKIVAKSFDEFVNVIANLSGLAANEILAEETGYYKDLYSKYVDTQISQQTSSKKRLESQLQALSGAKIGDTINVSELEGILGQSQYTVDSMKQLYVDLSRIAAKGGADIQSSISIIEEALASLFESWASAIAAGLGGTLSASQAEGLKKSFKLNDFDFTETAEGLQLSRAAAFEVYEQLEKIDKVKSKLVFDELANNLSETDENYANISKIMSRINELDSNVPTGRSKEYATELKLAQDILKTRSMTDADSFKLMDQDLPEAMQGPVNAWESMFKSYNAVNEGLKSGKMGIEDFYNFANNIVPMMEQAGVEVFEAGYNSADLIQRGFDALSYIDGEGLQVSLGDLGLNFAAGAADMQSGFKAGFDDLADSQIAMLDAAINMLEAIVAMEELDIDGNGLDLGDLFVNGSNSQGGWTDSANDWFKKFEAMNGVVLVGNQTLQEFLTSLGDTEGDAQAVLAIFKELNSMDWGDGSDSFERLQTVLGQYTNQDITIGESIFSTYNIPKNVDRKSQEFTTWVKEYFDNNEQMAENFLSVMEQGKKIADLNTKGPFAEAVRKILGLNEYTEGLLKGITQDGKTVTAEDLQFWSQIDITTQTDGKVTGATYTASDGSTLSLDTEDSSSWRTQIAEYENGIIIKNATGQTTEVRSDQSVQPVTLKNGIVVNGAISETGQGGIVASYEGESKLFSGDNAVEQARAWIKQKAEEKLFGYGEEVGMKNPTVGEDGQINYEASATVVGDIDIKNAESIASMSIDQIQGLIDNATRSEDGSFTLNGLTFKGDATAEDVRKAFAELTDSTFFSNLPGLIAEGVSKAFSGDAGASIGEALTTGVVTSLSGKESLEVELPELKIKPTSLQVDASSATVEPAEGEISLTNSIPEIKATADKITITLATNYEAAPGSVATGLEYETGEGTAEEVSVSSDSYKDVKGTTIDDIKYELVNGNIDTITITAKKHEDSDQSPDLGDYTGTPTATADSAKVTVQEYEITFTDQDGNVTKTLTVSGTAELAGVLGGIAGLTKNGEGNYQLAETIDNLTINVVMPNYDDVLKLIESLTGKKDLIIETSYVDSNGNPIIGQEEGALGYFGSGNQTVGYGVSGNNGQSVQSYGVYSSLSEAVKRLNALNNNPEVSQPEIQEIYADGSSITVPQATISVMSATLQNGQSGGGNPTRGGVSGQGQSGGNQGTNGRVALPGDVPDLSAAVSAANAQLSNLAAAINRIPDKSKAVNDTADAINKLRDKKVNVHVQVPTNASFTVKANVVLNVSSTGAVRVSRTSITDSGSTGNFTIPVKSNVLAKGNVALAQGSAAAGGKRTLVGELGPELVVSDGHYYTVGDAGAEFVNLPDDAIVFNHLQTRRLLGKKRGGIDSRGVPITNERRAVAFARGGETGPAMASADAVLSRLKQLRAMWQAMKDASASDLGSKAGGGGGGGGGGGKDDAFIEMIDRWYNYVRQIDNLEQHINLEEAKRKNLIDGYLKQGYSYAESLEQQLDYLKEQQSVYKDLATLQRDYYDKRQQELANSKYAQIFTYNDEGLQQYTQGKNKGIDALAFLNQQDAYGAAKLSAKKQYEYLVKELGFTYDDLKTDSSGKVAKKNDYAALVQNFFDNVDAWKDELDSLWDEVAEGLQNIEDNQAAQQEILQQFTDNQLSIEDSIMTALTDMRQKLIDDLQEELDELQDAGDKYIDDLTDALDRERKMYEDSQREKETASLQTQLAILKRTGASASSIRSLESQLDNRYQEDYFNEQQDQIDKVQESLDTQIERMEEQIKIETESLEYQKKNGLLWEQVYSMMATWGEGQLAQFIQEGTQSFHEKSPLGLQEEMKTILQQIQIYLEKSASDAYKAFLSETGLEGDDELKEAFMTAYGESRNIETATQAAQAIITRREEEQQRVPETPPTPPEPEQPTFNVIGTGKVKAKSLKVHKDSNVNSEQIGGVKEGQAVELLGKRGSWYKIVYNGQEGWVSTKWVSVKDDIKKKLPQFKEGGMVDFTGPAMVHGTKSKPEAFIDAEDTALLKSTIFSKSNNSLRAMIDSLNQFIDNISHHSGATNENITIENISLNFEPGVISNDYSAKRAGQTIKEEILSIARKAGNWSR